MKLRKQAGSFKFGDLIFVIKNIFHLASEAKTWWCSSKQADNRLRTTKGRDHEWNGNERTYAAHLGHVDGGCCRQTDAAYKALVRLFRCVYGNSTCLLVDA
jgi:hypothetical protein